MITDRPSAAVAACPILANHFAPINQRLNKLTDQDHNHHLLETKHARTTIAVLHATYLFNCNKISYTMLLHANIYKWCKVHIIVAVKY